MKMSEISHLSVTSDFFLYWNFLPNSMHCRSILIILDRCRTHWRELSVLSGVVALSFNNLVAWWNGIEHYGPVRLLSVTYGLLLVWVGFNPSQVKHDLIPSHSTPIHPTFNKTEQCLNDFYYSCGGEKAEMDPICTNWRLQIFHLIHVVN